MLETLESPNHADTTGQHYDVVLQQVSVDKYVEF